MGANGEIQDQHHGERKTDVKMDHPRDYLETKLAGSLVSWKSLVIPYRSRSSRVTDAEPSALRRSPLIRTQDESPGTRASQ